MKRRREVVAPNYWPGYVDAMTNVVLNLLFMVAMFGITLAVFSTQPQHTGSAGPGGTASDAAPQGQGAGVASPPQSGALDLMASLNLGAVSSIERGHSNQLSSEPAARVAAPAPPSSDPSEFSIVDAYRRKGGPDVDIQRRRGADGSTLLTLDIAGGAQPGDVLSRPAFVEALGSALEPRASRYLIWTLTTAPNDPVARRAAYLAVSTLRNQLIGLGVPEGRIETRLLPGTATSGSGLKLFMSIN